MQIEIKRFGPVSSFVCNLERDLTLIYGNNNIGKSYSMQIIYLLLKTIIGKDSKLSKYISLFLLDEMDLLYESKKKIKRMVYDFIKNSNTSKHIINVIERTFYNLLGEIIMPEFINSCYNTFGNMDKTLEKNPVIKINYSKFNFKIDLKRKRIYGIIKEKIYFDEKSPGSVEDILYFIIKEIGKLLSSFIGTINSICGEVYFLPASRSGIYSGMNSFGAIIAELSKSRLSVTKKIEIPAISEPIADYFIYLSNIKPGTNKDLEEFYTDIEDNILKGKVSFDTSKNALIYRPVNVDADFEMTEVSSMVSEITPVVAFLKFIIKKENREEDKRKPVLFIEEPEAHLHPQNQIALMEIFAKLIQNNVKLIMSSHSNYIFNKLNNLVLGKKLDYNVYQPVIMQEEQEGSISKLIEIDELGAEDQNFVDVSERLYYEREDIIQKLNMED